MAQRPQFMRPASRQSRKRDRRVARFAFESLCNVPHRQAATRSAGRGRRVRQRRRRFVGRCRGLEKRFGNRICGTTKFDVDGWQGKMLLPPTTMQLHIIAGVNDRGGARLVAEGLF